MKTKKLAEKYSGKALAESFVFRTKISDKENRESNAALKKVREKTISQLSTGDTLRLQLLQLKYQMEDWAKNPGYDAEKTFGKFLKLYAKIIQRKNFELANDISINTTRFSQIVNSRVLPSEKIVYRLECHCNSLIPANTWFDILEKDIENKMRFDLNVRKSEYSCVKNRIVWSKNEFGFVKTKKSEIAAAVAAYTLLITAAIGVADKFKRDLDRSEQLVHDRLGTYSTKKNSK